MFYQPEIARDLAWPVHPGHTHSCLFGDPPQFDAPTGKFSYHCDDDPFTVAEDLMEAHGLVSRGSVDDGTLSGILMSACCDGFFEAVQKPILAADFRTRGPDIAEDLVDLVQAAKRVARWKGQWAHGAFLELALLDLFDVDGLEVVLPAIERLVEGYRDAPFDIHDYGVLDQMVLPFVRFFECLKPAADEAQLRAFVLDGLRGRWPVTEDEVLASIVRVTDEQ